jgi:hypothetical protein
MQHAALVHAILDTNVVSEAMKPEPDAAVRACRRSGSASPASASIAVAAFSTSNLLSKQWDVCIDDYARRHGMSRSGFLAQAAQQAMQRG